MKYTFFLETETDLHREQMREYRELFISLLKERKFLPMALVRGRGKIEGYMSSKVGIIKTEDGRNSDNSRVLFHMTDIYLFGKPLANAKEDAFLVLVGDHMQLPPFCKSRAVFNFGFAMSLYERLRHTPGIE